MVSIHAAELNKVHKLTKVAFALQGMFDLKFFIQIFSFFEDKEQNHRFSGPPRLAGLVVMPLRGLGSTPLHISPGLIIYFTQVSHGVSGKF